MWLSLADFVYQFKACSVISPHFQVDEDIVLCLWTFCSASESVFCLLKINDWTSVPAFQIRVFCFCCLFVVGFFFFWVTNSDIGIKLFLASQSTRLQKWDSDHLMYLCLGAWVLHVWKQWSVLYLDKKHRGILGIYGIYCLAHSSEILKVQ